MLNNYNYLYINYITITIITIIYKEILALNIVFDTLCTEMHGIYFFSKTPL